ncbi:carbon-nitrogen hydrolase family protein [Rothia uropygioeca]|uniref:carbon-nitrogen hydrolase family protein n=1 Tax=Kocuria sp. 257 TaxID=2021970 RepID=UPI00101295EB|nr:carbon-nitrogen hydrolase family protein [Kocuria sp. 257]
MKIAIAQINSSEIVSENLSKVQDCTRRAREEGAELVVFPEATMTAFGSDLFAAATEHAEMWKTEMQWLAAEQEISLVTGEFAPAEDGKVQNILAVYTPSGERLDYAKIHLYDAFGFTESNDVAPGNDLLVVNIGGVSVGLSLCYDIRFPKLFAELSRKGAQVSLVAASWAAGSGKVEQWETLARARALDSNTIVVAVDQADPKVSGVNVNPKAPTGVGHSIVSDPFGHVIASFGEAEELQVLELDLGVVEQAEKSIPVLENAKLGY